MKSPTSRLTGTEETNNACFLSEEREKPSYTAYVADRERDNA